MNNSRGKGRICTPNCSSENSGHFFNGHPERKLLGVRNHRCSLETELHNQFLPICSKTREFVFSNQEVFVQFISHKDGMHVFIHIYSKFQTLSCKFYRTRRKGSTRHTRLRGHKWASADFHSPLISQSMGAENILFSPQRSG